MQKKWTSWAGPRHMPDTPLQVPSRNMYPFFSTFVCVAVNVYVHKSSHSFPMQISAPYCMWGRVCSVLSIVYIKGMSFSCALWVSCIRLSYGRITCGPCVFFTLFSQGVSTLVQFYVAPVYEIPYICLLVGGFPLQLLHSLVFSVNYSSTVLLSS